MAGIKSHVTYREEEAEAQDDRLDAKHRLPVLPQDIEADFAFEVDVGMENLQSGPGCKDDTGPDTLV